MLPKLSLYQAEQLRILAQSLNETVDMVNTIREQGYHAKSANHHFSNRDHLQEKIAELYGAFHTLFDTGDLSKELCVLEMTVNRYPGVHYSN